MFSSGFCLFYINSEMFAVLSMDTKEKIFVLLTRN